MDDSTDSTSDNYATILLLGSRGCGKSALIRRALVGAFSGVHRPTLGAELFEKDQVLDVVPGDAAEEVVGSGLGLAAPVQRVTLRIWSCGGSERLRPVVAKLYAQDVRTAVLVVDMTSELSMEETRYWYNEMLRACPQAKVVLVATKSDVSRELIRVSEDDVAAQAESWNVPHHVVSAKTGRNVDAVFAAIATMIKAPTAAAAASKS